MKKTHGHNSRTFTSPTYRSWTNMKTRCSNANSPDFKNWGGRGIRVCERWASFENFLADMGERPAGTTLHRIENDGHYEPGNCKWASAREQRAGQRSKLPVQLNGVTMPALYAARLLGVPWRNFYARIHKYGADKAVAMAQEIT